MFLDASVFIWALERPESNSARVVRAALGGKFEAVVDEAVVAEVGHFLRAHRGRSFAWLYTEQIRRSAVVITESDCKAEFAHIGARLKRNDGLHLAATRAAGARMLVAFDSDFEPFPEYVTPRAAARRLGLGVSPSDW